MPTQNGWRLRLRRSTYRAELAADPANYGASDKLAVALLVDGDFDGAEQLFMRTLQRDRGLPAESLVTFDEERDPGPSAYVAGAAPFKLTDRSQQLRYLVGLGRIDPSFEGLARRYDDLLSDIEQDEERQPYTPLREHQARPFAGFYDKLVHVRHTPALPSSNLNPALDFSSIETAYQQHRTVVLDDVLTPEALAELRRFFLKSQV